MTLTTDKVATRGRHVLCRRQVRDCVMAHQGELARLGHFSRARLTQIMNLLNLAGQTDFH